MHDEALTHAIRDLWRVEGAYVRGVPVCGIAPLPLYAAWRIAAPFLSAILPRGEVCDTQFLHALSYGAPFLQSIAKQSAPLQNLTSPMCHNLGAEMRTCLVGAAPNFHVGSRLTRTNSPRTPVSPFTVPPKQSAFCRRAQRTV